MHCICPPIRCCLRHLPTAFEAASRVRAQRQARSSRSTWRRASAAGCAAGARARRLIRRAAPDVLFANERETAALVGERPRGGGAASGAGAGGGRQGGGGRLSSGKAPGAVEIDVATKTLRVDDTTGAGDAFDAGFLYSLIAERALLWRRSECRGAAARGGRWASVGGATADRAAGGVGPVTLSVSPRIQAALPEGRRSWHSSRR